MKWILVALLAAGTLAANVRKQDRRNVSSRTVGGWGPPALSRNQRQQLAPNPVNPNFNNPSGNWGGNLDVASAAASAGNFQQNYMQSPSVDSGNSLKEVVYTYIAPKSGKPKPGNPQSVYDVRNVVDPNAEPGVYNSEYYNAYRNNMDVFMDEIPQIYDKLKETVEEFSIWAPPLFVFHYGDSADKYEFKDAVTILKNPNFDNNKRTVVYIHGFLEGEFVESVQHVVATYKQRGDHNILVLDWHAYALPEYFLNAVPNVKKVGTKAGVAILDMINSGLNLQRLHVVGHSLGGQMAGVIGRTIQRESVGAVILKRISALDPAFPGFYGIPTITPLNEEDAEYVDVLHTDAGIYGAPATTGTVDFWPNGGLHPQPGCSLINVCSHQRSWWYWTDSLAGNWTKQFNAVKANDWNAFRNGNVDKFNDKIAMGISCPSDLYENYFLHTNHEEPFAKGVEGVAYEAHLDSGKVPPTPLLQPNNYVVVH